MAKFVFRLQSYLGVKEKIEEQKKLEYGKSLARLEEEKQTKIQLENKRLNCINAMRESIAKGINPYELKEYNSYIDILKKKIQEQLKVIENAQQDAERCRIELVEAMKQRKMLETLKEKDKEEYIKEVFKEQEKITDEIVSYQYNNKE